MDTSTSLLQISVLVSNGRVQVTKKHHENSGGYAYVYCLLYIVMCAILCVVAYFLSVNLLHMHTVFALYVWHPQFPLEE